MQLLLKNSPNAGYTTNDVVYIAPDDHEWGRGELDTDVFTIVKNVELTEDEINRLKMVDFQMVFPKTALKMLNQRSRLVRLDNIEHVRRRRYYYDDGLKRKYT